MTVLQSTAVIAALLGCAVIGGVFFAFSNFVMPALARVPATAGIEAMQSINVVVLNRWFLGVFMATAAICLLLAFLAIDDWVSPAAPWVLTGALLYLVGTWLVTVLGNVPLNNELAAVRADTPAAIPVWRRYLTHWTRLNTVRTLAACAAALLLAVGLTSNQP